MNTMEESKLFAKWLIKCTEEVNTLGACRRYKGKVLNVDELYTEFVDSELGDLVYKKVPEEVYNDTYVNKGNDDISSHKQ